VLLQLGNISLSLINVNLFLWSNVKLLTRFSRQERWMDLTVSACGNHMAWVVILIWQQWMRIVNKSWGVCSSVVDVLLERKGVDCAVEVSSVQFVIGSWSVLDIVSMSWNKEVGTIVETSGHVPSASWSHESITNALRPTNYTRWSKNLLLMTRWVLTFQTSTKLKFMFFTKAVWTVHIKLMVPFVLQLQVKLRILI